MEDVAPELLKNIEKDFREQFNKDSIIADLTKKLEKGTATYLEAYKYAGRIGTILTEAYKRNISSDALPEGKMWYNIANRVITPTMKQNYDFITKYVDDVQENLNKKAGIGIKPVTPKINNDRINGIVNRISSEDNYDNISWILDAPVKTVAKSIVDDSIRENSEFHAKAGMQPRIIRKTTGNCCKWCSQIAGIYKYPDVPKDVYRRHENCDCTVEYDPGDGKRQNVWSKQWKALEDSEKKEERKLIGLPQIIKGEDVTKQYISNATPQKGSILFGDGYNKKMHMDEIETANLIHRILGGDIMLLQEVNANNVKTADYIWNGKYWDLKSTSTAKAANSAIRHGLKQIRENPGGVILNYNNNKIVLEDVIDVIEKRMQWSNLGQVDIMIIANNKIEKILRYK